MSNQQSKALGSPLMTIKNELLHGAVVSGELPTVRRLLDRHRADINTKNSNGIGCLQLALLNGHSKLAEFLIQKGIDIHMADPDGYTALHDAAVVENAVLVHKLISKGLSPLLTTNKGELVIDVAGSLQMEKLLCEEMYRVGEVQLARQHYVYLGLDRDETEKIEAIDSGSYWRSPDGRWGHSHPPRGHQKHHGGSVGSKSSPHPQTSPPKPTIKKPVSSQSKSQVSKNISTHASRIHPSAKIANSSESGLLVSGRMDCQATPELGCLPNHGKGNHRNANVEAVESYKEPVLTKEADQSTSLETLSGGRLEVIFSEESSGNSSGGDLSSDSSDSSLPVPRNKKNQSTKPKARLGRELLSRSSREFNQQASNLSPKQVRETAAIKALQRHSSFQLQIGLSLQSEHFSSLQEEDDIFAADKDKDQFADSSSLSASSSSRFSVANSPRVSSRRHCASIQSDWFLTEQQQGLAGKPSSFHNRQRKHITPLLKKTISFADLPMTRNKPMFVGQSSNQGSGAASSATSTPAEKKENVPNRTMPSQLGLSLSATNILDRYISNYNPLRGGGEGSEEIDPLFIAGIRALRMKPHKSIIASPMRRHNSEGGTHRRRSVSFQPEVLLQEIVTDGDVKAVSEILESGMIADVNKMSPSGLTALHQSAIDGNLECAKTLVMKGADVNCTDCENWTPLHAAVMNGSIEFVRFLLASGAKPNLKNDAGETAYDMAKKNVPIRKMLLQAMNGRSLDADEFSDGEYSGEEEEEYSHAESESDDDDLEGEESALFDSTAEEKTSLKERLGLTHTVALNNVNSNSVTPSPDLDNVFSGSQIYPRRDHELTDSTSSYGSLFESDDRIKDSNTKNCNNESDTDKISESGISTMEGSSDCSHRSRVLSSEDEVITLDSDLDPESLDYDFQEACLYCDVDRVLKLIRFKHDIDINRVNKTSGITALHHSVLEENFALVQHLVKDFEADLHVQDIEGWTPLHAASAVGSIQIAQFLLDKGAKPSSLNLSCEFPVDVAEDEAMEKLLKNAMLGHSTEKVLKR